MRQSAGILAYRWAGSLVEVLLVHPGGPFWQGKDAGAWMVPKGEVEPGETPIAAATREFAEELGVPLPGVPWPLARLRQAGGKWVEAFALEADINPDTTASGSFDLEWPPGSGRRQAFPEVDGARWFPLAEARTMILASQRPILDALADRLASIRAGFAGDDGS